MTIYIIVWILANLAVWRTACTDPGVIPPLSFYQGVADRLKETFLKRDPNQNCE